MDGQGQVPVRYRGFVADSARWDGVALRPDDIVLSTPAKSGTTWMQMLIAMLVFDGPDLPAPLDVLSPWVDMQTRPAAEIHSAVAAQRHRRFLKTHTPLDGLPWDDRVTYVVVGRDPRDVFVSMQHHLANMDLVRLTDLRRSAVGLADVADLPPLPETPAEQLREFLMGDGSAGLSLSQVLHHLDTGWQRRHLPNVALFHYADLTSDLPGELLRLAEVLGYRLDRGRAEELAAEATFGRMRDRAGQLAPEVSIGLWRDTNAFFRRGGGGEWQERFTGEDRAAYDRRLAELVEPGLAAWAHHGWRRRVRHVR